MRAIKKDVWVGETFLGSGCLGDGRLELVCGGGDVHGGGAGASEVFVIFHLETHRVDALGRVAMGSDGYVRPASIIFSIIGPIPPVSSDA